jgi:thiol:disulfide interchange protein DsbC
MILRLSSSLAAALGLLSLAVGGLVSAQPAAPAAAAPAMSESVPSTQGDSTLDAVKKAFEGHFPGIEVTAVAPTPYAGLYEIQLGTDVLYTNARADYVLQGSLVDSKTRVDLTAERLAKLSQIAFDSLPLKLAVKEVKGDGSRKLAAFEDPNCPYCKQLHKTLEQLNNYTFYTFLFPILTPDSEVKARDIWCAKDPGATWRDWMVNGKTPATAQCDTPVEDVLALGKKLAIQGTPTIIFADGTRVNGTLPLDGLKEKLDSLK